MIVDVIVDLQFGSTGKGAVAAALVTSLGMKYDSSVRVQSVQAGHTVYFKGKPYKMRTIPCAWVDPDVKLVLGAGCFLNKELLLREIDMIREATGRDPRERLIVDPRAFYVTAEDEAEEVSRKLDRGMGSTAHGAGSSLIRKLWRTDFSSGNGRVGDDPWAAGHGIRVEDTISRMQGQRVLLEGCQGTMLSIHTSPYYPFVTTREATASGIAAEAGVPPSAVRNVFGVFRTLPIRVGGNSGPTGSRELGWAEVDRRSGRKVEPERTTVTNRVRRIFEFDDEDFRHALRVNLPTHLFMTFADYLAPGIYGASRLDDLDPYAAEMLDKAINRAEALSQEVSRKAHSHCATVDWVGTGEAAEHFININPIG